IVDVDSDGGTTLQTLELPKTKAWWYGLAWHPEGRLLAATCDDTKIHIWDTKTGTEAMPALEGHVSGGIYMAFNPTGDRLLSGGWDLQARLWDTGTGRLLLTMPGRYGGSFNQDGSLIGLEQSGTKLRLWRLADGRELRVIRRPKADRTATIGRPVLHADERILAATADSGLVFFDLTNGSELAFIDLKNTSRIFSTNSDQSGGWLTCG